MPIFKYYVLVLNFDWETSTRILLLISIDVTNQYLVEGKENSSNTYCKQNQMS